MAATYPLEVVQAARFLDSRPGLQGDALARAIAPMPWDPSVKSLAQFPSVLAMMNDKLDWTQRLGDAFLSQQANVMDTVQNLRIRAQIAGNLQSTDQQRIVQQDQVIVIEPVNPQVIYVPYYNPIIVYGSWWWPQRPPVYWAPPPRYRPPSYNVSINAGIFFGAGIGIVRSVYNDARPDWRQHHVLVNNVRINNVNVTKNVVINNRPVVWEHNRRDGQNRQRPDVGNVSRPNIAPAVSNAPNPSARPDLHPGQPSAGQGREDRDRADRNHRPEQYNRPPQAAGLPAPHNAPIVQNAPRPAPPPPAAAQLQQARPATPVRPEHVENNHRPEPQAFHRPPPAAAPVQQMQRPMPEMHAPAPRPERQEQSRPEPKPQQREEHQQRQENR